MLSVIIVYLASQPCTFLSATRFDIIVVHFLSRTCINCLLWCLVEMAIQWSQDFSDFGCVCIIYIKCKRGLATLCLRVFVCIPATLFSTILFDRVSVWLCVYRLLYSLQDCLTIVLLNHFLKEAAFSHNLLFSTVVSVDNLCECVPHNG